MRFLTQSGALKPWPTALALLLCVGLTVGFGIAYVRKVDRASERRNVERGREICGIIRLIDDRNQEMPPATDPDTAAFRAELHRYRVNLGC